VTKKVCDTILDAVGHTPLVRINRITRGIVKGTVYAKVETFNPGNSIKDRMAIQMIEDAERSGKLKPGGTIIEGTSGNTGMGLAMAAVVKGNQVPPVARPRPTPAQPTPGAPPGVPAPPPTIAPAQPPPTP